jgi:hypothetical protein
MLFSTYKHFSPTMDINYEKIQAIAQKYGCPTPVNTKYKPFINALLQYMYLKL